ncbi:MAG TPA: hypothetical protein VLE02_01765 [Nitrosarchaeum sp.]|nr:hypothetical protein [Nitrosarchaeum sp.]
MKKILLILVVVFICLLFFTLFVIQCAKRKHESYFTENYSHPVNTKMWPSYYYTTPYNYKYGGAWPPHMYSRLYYWSPTYFAGNGLSYNFRPGVGYRRDGWQRNLYIRNNNDKFYVSNRDDDSHDALDYTFKGVDFS